jgi:hypothetical protein
VLALKLICPVFGLITRPAGVALNVPPAGLLITGVGLGPDGQKVPDEYWNSGLGTLVTFTVTAVRGLEHWPDVFCT